MSCSAPASVSSRKFDVETDSIWLHGLWHRAMHRRWSISQAAMQQVLVGTDLQVVAEHNGIAVAFCAVDLSQHGQAAIIVLLVDPDSQRLGIGTGLLRMVESTLREQGVTEISLGAGGNHYFWPGLPEEQQGAREFFRRQSFREEEPSEDLVQLLDVFKTPAWVSDRQLSTGATIHLGEPAWSDRILAFEQRYFPVWAPFLQNELQQGALENILFALGPDHRILGTLLMKRDASALWQETQGTQIGTLNTLGVAPESQGKRIGLTLTAGAMEHLHRSGCSHCYIQWTGLAKWYGKLGAKPWAHYHMASKLL